MTTYSTLPYDILYQFCLALQTVDSKTLKDFSLVNKRTRSAAIPALFRSVAYLKQWGNEGWGYDRVPWLGVPELIATLMENEEILSSVRRFKFQPWVVDPGENPIPQQFFHLLRAFQNLTDLELMAQTQYLDQMREELLGLNAAEMKQPGNNGAQNYHIFRSVQSLTIRSPVWLKLYPLFPNICSLEIDSRDAYNYWPQVVVDYQHLSMICPNLKRLHSPELGVSSILQEIGQHFPNIEDLGLFGSLDVGKGGCILDHLPSYAHLTQLHSLSLPDESRLGLGFYRPRRRCGLAHRTPGARERVMKERLEAQARLFQGVEAELIRMENGHKKGALRQLTLGDPKKTVYLVGPDGKLKEAAASDD